MSNQENKDKTDHLIDYGIAGASEELTNKFGAAIKEHLSAYSGIDYENGIKYTKNLKNISHQSINPGFKAQNLKQHAGFAAEVKESARENADRIINGNPTRKVRMDDLGAINDPIYDHIDLDSSGNIVQNTGSQMKFVGSTPEEALNKLLSKKFQKYLEANAQIDVPADYFKGIMDAADKRISTLDSQLKEYISENNLTKAEDIQKKIDKLNQIKNNLHKSKVTNNDAIFAVSHPKLSTLNDIVELGNRAGIEGAQYGAIIGGCVSIIQNTVSLVQGKIETSQAIQNIATDTAKSAAIGYGTGFMGSTLKGVMKHSASTAVRSFANTALPTAIVAVALTTNKVLKRYLGGESTSLECIESLGQEGVNMLGSACFAAIGTIAIPIPVLGGLIGGMLGYALSSASYSILLNSLKEAQYAHEERIRIERECAEHITLIRSYRQEVEKIIQTYLIEKINVFQSSFDNMKEALSIGNVDGFIAGANSISNMFGRNTQFNNINEFDKIMNSSETFKL